MVQEEGEPHPRLQSVQAEREGVMKAPHPESPWVDLLGLQGPPQHHSVSGDVIRVVSDTSSVPAVCWVAVDKVEATSTVVPSSEEITSASCTSVSMSSTGSWRTSSPLLDKSKGGEMCHSQSCQAMVPGVGRVQVEV